MTALKPVPPGWDITMRLRDLCSPLAESLSDGERLTALVHAGTAAAVEISRLTRQLEDAREALDDLVDSLTPAESIPIKDPAYGDEVRAIGMRIGFGALMDSASYEWRAWLAENAYPLGSEFVAGPCRAVLESDMKRARQALKEINQ